MPGAGVLLVYGSREKPCQPKRHNFFYNSYIIYICTYIDLYALYITLGK